MKSELIDYSALVDSAMHLIVKKSLEIFSASDNRGDHHFYISFITKYPEVVLSDKLHNRYPYEMTIVLQHQFEELKIEDDKFSVLLSFDGEQERVVVPFAALSAFADPSVKFGLQFRHVDDLVVSNKSETHHIKEPQSKSKPSKNTSKSSSNIIALDFHNKKRL